MKSAAAGVVGVGVGVGATVVGAAVGVGETVGVASLGVVALGVLLAEGVGDGVGVVSVAVTDGDGVGVPVVSANAVGATPTANSTATAHDEAKSDGRISIFSPVGLMGYARVCCLSLTLLREPSGSFFHAL